MPNIEKIIAYVIVGLCLAVFRKVTKVVKKLLLVIIAIVIIYYLFRNGMI